MAGTSNMLSCADIEQFFIARTAHVKCYVAMMSVVVPALEKIRDTAKEPEIRELAAKALVDMDRAAENSVVHSVAASIAIKPDQP